MNMPLNLPDPENVSTGDLYEWYQSYFPELLERLTRTASGDNLEAIKALYETYYVGTTPENLQKCVPADVLPEEALSTIELALSTPVAQEVDDAEQITAELYAQQYDMEVEDVIRARNNPDEDFDHDYYGAYLTGVKFTIERGRKKP